MKFSDVFEENEKPRTDNYRFTHHRENPMTWLKLKQLKGQIGDHNRAITKGVKDGSLTQKTRHWSGGDRPVQGEWVDKDGNTHVKKKVSMFGRLGRENPAASDYSRKNPDRSKSKQRIHPDDAERFDVYVHDARRYKYD